MRPKMSRDGLLWAVTLTMMSCTSDAFVAGDYRGEPLFSVRGDIAVAQGGSFGTEFISFDNVKLAIYWVGDARARVLGRQATGRSEFPSGYSMTLFSAPTSDLYTEVSGATGPLAVGFVIAYIDDNQDDAWDSSEQLIGSNAEIALIFRPEEPYDGEGPFEVGYNIARVGSCARLEEMPGSALLTPLDNESRIPITLSAEVPAFLLDLDCDGQREDLPIPTKDRCWPYYERFTSFREMLDRGTPTPDLMTCYPPERGPHGMQLCHQRFLQTDFCPEPVDMQYCERDLCLAAERGAGECETEIIEQFDACEAAD